jgi:cobalt-zinc-cadmium efflux system outer membrane protein
MRATMVVASAIGALAFGLGLPRAAAAASSCSERVTRATIIACALDASLTARAEQIGVSALDGRRRAASVLLPSNPTLSVTGGLPADPSATEHTPLWSAALSQEIEVAGQRGARLDVVDAETRAQHRRVAAARRQAAADALVAYYDAIASAEHLHVARRLTMLANALKEVARARAEVGVGSDVDTLLADAAAIRIEQAQIGAAQQAAAATATLAALLGFDPLVSRPEVDGELEPLPIASSPAAALVEKAISQRADLAVLTAERDAQERRIKMLERLRIPNPTLSVYARRDWIGERNVGLGLSFPIPLPAPVGRTYAGEIAEITALTGRAAVDASRLQRAIRLEVVNAFELVQARQRQVDLYTPEQIARANRALDAIAEQLIAKRLPVREAVISQQALIELLSGSVEAQRSLCRASVDLARVAGVELERGLQ